MEILRLFVGTFYDLGRVVASLAALGAIGYLVKSFVTDSPADGEAAVVLLVACILAALFARIFRRYAI